MYLLYDKDTGKIRSKVSCTLESIKLDISEKVGCIDCEYNDDVNINYVQNNKLVPRPYMNLEYTETQSEITCGEVISISGIPLGTQITITDTDYGICNDKELNISFDIPDIYYIELVNFPYLTRTFNYHVN